MNPVSSPEGDIKFISIILGKSTHISTDIYPWFSWTNKSITSIFSLSTILPDTCPSLSASFPDPVTITIPTLLDTLSIKLSNILLPLWFPLLLPNGSNTTNGFFSLNKTFFKYSIAAKIVGNANIGISKFKNFFV